MKAMTINVCKSNLSEELEVIASLRGFFPLVAIDTEFPGFLRSTPRHASEEDRYRDVKYNVDNMHLIQFGLALFDGDGRTPSSGCCWQFNFSDFDPDVHAASPDSIELLRRSGHDLHKNRQDGITAKLSSNELRDKLFSHRYKSKYITFHGLYDIAYLIKLITGEPLPITLSDFLVLATNIFGTFYDIKYVSRFCDGLLGGELGLMKMSKLLKMELEGTPHQAGYDSLLIGTVFREIKLRYNIKDEDERFVLVLYGVENSSGKRRAMGPRSIMAPPPPFNYPRQNIFRPHNGFMFQAPVFRPHGGLPTQPFQPYGGPLLMPFQSHGVPIPPQSQPNQNQHFMPTVPSPQLRPPLINNVQL